MVVKERDFFYVSSFFQSLPIFPHLARSHFHSADAFDLTAYFNLLSYFKSPLILRPQSQRVPPPPCCAVGSVSPGGAAALPARGSDGRQPAKRRGSHTTAAGTDSRQHGAPGAARTVRLTAQTADVMWRHWQMNRSNYPVIAVLLYKKVTGSSGE